MTQSKAKVVRLESSTDYVKPPGYAGWPADEVVPTVEEADNPLFDLSDFDNVRKLARAIASQNKPIDAGQLSGELSYAYRNGDYDTCSISESLSALGSDSDYQQLIDLLAPLADSNHVANLLLWSVTEAQEDGGISQSEPIPPDVLAESEKNKALPWDLAGSI